MALLAVVLVANVRRGRSGRRLIAVRTNERAAASLGINIAAAKLFAFAFASALAALGGILLAFRLTSVSYQSFTNFTSITYAGLSLVGGVGHVLGAFVGAMMATAGFNQEVMESTWNGVGEFVQLISGIAICWWCSITQMVSLRSGSVVSEFSSERRSSVSRISSSWKRCLSAEELRRESTGEAFGGRRSHGAVRNRDCVNSVGFSIELAKWSVSSGQTVQERPSHRCAHRVYPCGFGPGHRWW